MIDGTMNQALEHVGATMSKEDVISEYVTRRLEDMDEKTMYGMVLTSMYNKLATYTKEEIKTELEDQNIDECCTGSGIFDDLIEATQLWDLSTEEEG
jgi:hypothetical protein